MLEIDKLYKKISDGKDGKNIGLKTGINRLDKYTGGIQSSTYTLIFGLSGAGKSSYVLYANVYRPLKDYPDKDFIIYYYSLEMSETLLLAKLLSLYIYEEFQYIIPYTDMMSFQTPISDETYDYIVKGRKWLESISNKLIIYEDSLSAKSFYYHTKSELETIGEFTEIPNSKKQIYTKNKSNQSLYVIIDHIGLVINSEGHTKKQEIDMISQYCVYFRNTCDTSFFILQQENRNSSSMDRRKADMSECAAEDLKETGNTYNDCDICIGIYYPLLHGVKVHNKYPIILENQREGEFNGLRDFYRSATLIKNRNGVSNRRVAVNFFGEIGLFKELPKAEMIKDYSEYITLIGNRQKMLNNNSDKKII